MLKQSPGISTVDVELLTKETGIRSEKIQAAFGIPVELDQSLLEKIRTADSIKRIKNVRAEAIPCTQEEYLACKRWIEMCATIGEIDDAIHWMCSGSTSFFEAWERRKQIVLAMIRSAQNKSQALEAYNVTRPGSLEHLVAITKLAEFFHKI